MKISQIDFSKLNLKKNDSLKDSIKIKKFETIEEEKIQSKNSSKNFEKKNINFDKKIKNMEIIDFKKNKNEILSENEIGSLIEDNKLINNEYDLKKEDIDIKKLKKKLSVNNKKLKKKEEENNWEITLSVSEQKSYKSENSNYSENTKKSDNSENLKKNDISKNFKNDKNIFSKNNSFENRKNINPIKNTKKSYSSENEKSESSENLKKSESSENFKKMDFSENDKNEKSPFFVNDDILDEEEKKKSLNFKNSDNSIIIPSSDISVNLEEVNKTQNSQRSNKTENSKNSKISNNKKKDKKILKNIKNSKKNEKEIFEDFKYNLNVNKSTLIKVNFNKINNLDKNKNDDFDFISSEKHIIIEKFDDNKNEKKDNLESSEILKHLNIKKKSLLFKKNTVSLTTLNKLKK